MPYLQCHFQMKIATHAFVKNETSDMERDFLHKMITVA